MSVVGKRPPKFCGECGAPMALHPRLGVRVCIGCGDTIAACECPPFVQLMLVDLDEVARALPKRN